MSPYSEPVLRHSQPPLEGAPSDGMDLTCGERVAQSDTDSGSEAEIENKAFPQQRYSPAVGVKTSSNSIPESPLAGQKFLQKQFVSAVAAEVKFRPKPIKIQTRDAEGNNNVVGLGGDDGQLRRPASAGSTFQPKGDVFRVHYPKHKQELLIENNNNLQPELVHATDIQSTVANDIVSEALTIATSVVSSVPERSVSQVKTLHNISMTTANNHGVLMSSHIQTNLGSSAAATGAIMTKLTTPKLPKSFTKGNIRPIIATSFSQAGPATPGVPPVVTTAVIGTVSTPVVTSAGNKVPANPVPIASKPALPQPPIPGTPQATSPWTSVTPAVAVLNASTVTTAAVPTVTMVTQSMVTPTQPSSQSTLQVGQLLLKATLPPSPNPAIQPTVPQLLSLTPQTAPGTPTPIRYVLPSFNLTSGTVQGVLQMALPTTPIQTSMQFTFPTQVIQTTQPSTPKITVTPQPLTPNPQPLTPNPAQPAATVIQPTAKILLQPVQPPTPAAQPQQVTMTTQGNVQLTLPQSLSSLQGGPGVAQKLVQPLTQIHLVNQQQPQTTASHQAQASASKSLQAIPLATGQTLSLDQPQVVLAAPQQ